ncbi:MAG: hypothetical protein JOY82_20835 [Streptosporangiaceae bacterium]|nr:hypothetical protein [Streptosporangiaceae bacterium]MBV9856930.1 hypothetical protein [Streptosporangiaceae bacterium]
MPPRGREQRPARAGGSGTVPAAGRALLTFRLDSELRQTLKARLASDGRTLSEVVTHGLRQYVQRAGGRAPAARARRLADLGLPENLAARLRELRAAGRSEVLSASLAALHDSGWPLAALARALGISKQAVQARIRRAVRAHRDAPRPSGRAALTPPVFPRRRPPSANGRRPHLTVRVDRTLRSAAHDAAADEGSSLSQVVERILHRYLRHGLPGESAKRAARAKSR